MSNYYFHAVILNNCPYSEATYNFLKNKKNVKSIFTNIDYTEKENYKTSSINTFPQIYLKKNNSNGSLLIGGYDDLMNIYDDFYEKKYSDNKITSFINKTNWSKKITLRLIELINSK